MLKNVGYLCWFLSASERYAMHNVSDILFSASGVFLTGVTSLNNSIRQKHFKTASAHLNASYHFALLFHTFHTIMYGESGFPLQMDGFWPAAEPWLKLFRLKT